MYIKKITNTDIYITYGIAEFNSMVYRLDKQDDQQRNVSMNKETTGQKENWKSN